MGMNYKALLNGDIQVTDLVKAIFEVYGGENFKIQFMADTSAMMPGSINAGAFTIQFDQELSPEVKAMRPWERKPYLLHRQMSVYIGGACACDYRDVTTEPMTYIALGHWGECREIIEPLVARFGGWVMDEAITEEWERLSDQRHAELRDSNAVRAAQLRLAAAERDARIEASMNARGAK